MLSFSEVNFLFKILLNINIDYNIYLTIGNINKIDLINKIKKGNRFKKFRKDLNFYLENFILEKFKVKSSQEQIDKFLNVLIELGYNKNKFNNFYDDKIIKITNEYKKIYKNILKIDEDISNNEIFEILDLNIEVDFFIFTSDKYQKISNEKIIKLIN